MLSVGEPQSKWLAALSREREDKEKSHSVGGLTYLQGMAETV